MSDFEFVKSDLVAQLFERSRDPLVVLDLSGNIMEANRVARHAWGVSPSDLLPLERGVSSPSGEPLPTLSPAARGIPAKSRLSGGRGEVELWPLRDDRGDPSATGAVLVMGRDPADAFARDKDRSEMAALEAEIERSRAKLDDLRVALARSERLQLLGEFVTAIVHDLNNVLASAASAFRMIERATDSDRADDLAVEGSRALDRGAGLVRQMLDFARGSKEGAATISVRDVLDRLSQLIRSAASPLIDVEIRVTEDVGLIDASPSRLESVILNLTTNARDAMPSGGRLEISARNADPSEIPPGLPPGDFVRLDFAEICEGSESDTLTKVGKLFFTANGLSLASAFKFAEESGGRCIVASRLGSGTTVTLLMARRATDRARKAGAR